MENSGIAWTTHTHNAWIGCAEVSPGCDNCYARNLMDTRYGRAKWGVGENRQRTAEANRRKPLAWNRARAALIVEKGYADPVRVFSASLSDWLDHEVPAEWLADLLSTIAQTPALTWMLLSKRPAIWRKRLEAVMDLSPPSLVEAQPYLRLTRAWLNGQAPANVWVGTTVEDQERADSRIPRLLVIPAVVHFLSAEPLLGPVDVAAAGFPQRQKEHQDGRWIIVGGESQAGCRPMRIEWADSLRRQADDIGAAFFMKQMGGHPYPRHAWEDLPAGLQVREFPNPRTS